jgi:triacylglycerol esterase/lipase EstA (alpha/beta hydrolase family)
VPYPVLLVPGWSDRAKRLYPLRDDLLRAGWRANHIEVVDFRRRFGSNTEHAAEIAAALQRLVERTGADRVDVVAHSMGGLALRYYLHFGDAAQQVRRVIFTGTPHSGTWVAWLAWGAGARDMRPNSRFLRALNEVPALPAGIEALCLTTPTELRVLPRRSARLAGVRCKGVWCASHARMLRSRRVFAAVRAFLQE